MPYLQDNFDDYAVIKVIHRYFPMTYIKITSFVAVLLIVLPLAASAEIGNEQDLIRQLTQRAGELQAQLNQLRPQVSPQRQTESPRSITPPYFFTVDQEGDEAPPVAISFDRDLSVGLRNDVDVSNLQEFLIDQGFLAGSPTGNFFLLTRRAVQAFQKAHGLRPTGYFGPLSHTIANKMLAEEFRSGGGGGVGNLSGNLRPVISGLKGPTALKVGETGTWAVQASDPELGPLSYAVLWGDEELGKSQTSQTSPAAERITQTATVTHTYTKSGSFAPTFTVTDNGGLSAKTSASVVVGMGVSSAGALTISVAATPPAGTVATGARDFTFAKYIFDATQSSEDLYMTGIHARFRAYLSVYPQEVVTKCIIKALEKDGSVGFWTTGVNVVNPMSFENPVVFRFTFDRPWAIGKGTAVTVGLACDVPNNIAGAVFSWGLHVSEPQPEATGAITGQKIIPIVVGGDGQRFTIAALSESNASWKVYSIKEYGLTLKYPDKIGLAVFNPSGGYDPCTEGCPKNYFWEGELMTYQTKSIGFRLAVSLFPGGQDRFRDLQPDYIKDVNLSKNNLDVYSQKDDLDIEDSLGLGIQRGYGYRVFDNQRNLVIDFRFVKDKKVSQNVPQEERALIREIEDGIFTILPKIVNSLENTNKEKYPIRTYYRGAIATTVKRMITVTSPNGGETIALDGNYTIVKDSSAPASRTLAAGSTGVVITAIRLSAVGEDMQLKSLTLRFGGSNVYALQGQKFSVWDGATLVGSSGFPYSASAQRAIVSFVNPVVIPKDGAKTLTIKGDLASLSASTTGLVRAGDTVELHVETEAVGGTYGIGNTSGSLVYPKIDTAGFAGVITLGPSGVGARTPTERETASVLAALQAQVDAITAKVNALR